VRTILVIIATPGLDQHAGLNNIHRTMQIEAFIPPRPIKSRDEGVVGRFAPLREVGGRNLVYRHTAKKASCFAESCRAAITGAGIVTSRRFGLR
jgi:hypothetical protein